MKKWIVALFVVFFFASCETDNAPSFTKPQPAAGKELAAFPKKMQGAFISNDEISVLTITDNLLTILYDFDERLVPENYQADDDDSTENKEQAKENGSANKMYYVDSKNSLYFLKGDSLYAENDNVGKFGVKRLGGDTLLMHINFTDTIFELTNKNNILKEYKGNLFLNEYADWEKEHNSWHTRKLSLKNGLLSIALITTNDDLNNVQQMDESADTVTYNLQPTHKEFKDIPYSENIDTFYKMRKY